MRLALLLCTGQFPQTPMAPAQRQKIRIAKGFEIVYPVTGNGSLFTISGGGSLSGSIGYGILRWEYNLNESYIDHGVKTQDKYLQAALRSLGLYNEQLL